MQIPSMLDTLECFELNVVDFTSRILFSSLEDRISDTYTPGVVYLNLRAMANIVLQVWEFSL